MLEIALTGTRYSGKTGVGKLFKQIQVPVFDADTILKYILNFKPETQSAIYQNIGSYLFNNGKLDASFFITTYLFNKTIDLCEFELFEAWSRFKQKHADKPYVIFESSIIFERNWQSRFSGTICVFSPKEERVRRARENTGKRIDHLWTQMDTEISEFDKNTASTWIVHNYEDAPDILKQVNSIDTKIIDLYLEKDKLKTF